MRAIGVFRAVLCLLLAGSAACGRKPASIHVSPREVVLYGLERSQRLTAQLLDSRNVMPSTRKSSV